MRFYKKTVQRMKLEEMEGRGDLEDIAGFLLGIDVCCVR